MRFKPRSLQAELSSARHMYWRLAIGVWSVAVVAAFVWMTRYEYSTGGQGDWTQAGTWPCDSLLSWDTKRPTLLLFVHPHCPCTRATIRELRRVLEHSHHIDRARPDVQIVVSVPSTADVHWAQTATVRAAQDLPGARLFLDRGGQESDRFGAVSSGTVMLYSTTGQQLFAGGVTVARGHEGDSSGAAQLRERLRDPLAQPCIHFPAFGCRLCLPDNDTT